MGCVAGNKRSNCGLEFRQACPEVQEILENDEEMRENYVKGFSTAWIAGWDARRKALSKTSLRVQL